jgi:hypothetical protein
MANPIVGKNAAGQSIDAQGNVVPEPNPATPGPNPPYGQASVTTENLRPGQTQLNKNVAGPVNPDVIIPAPPPGWGPNPIPGTPEWDRWNNENQQGWQAGTRAAGPGPNNPAYRGANPNVASPNNPPVTVQVLSVNGVSINLPAGATVNANGTIILADGSAVNPLDAVRAWRNGQKHL